ncbi:LysR family transcriptional regulator [Herbaspirillum sp. alder98]|uniref:LysR family transcriptional regulator n=1 Tax=Herbaspirillum sp. alder98 TaxID=2913096 RepID=UPI001CD89D8D|nr:LysR family transcriptional regulator [Herbaspirillum sp. alder98]MCA1326743.1 LysR family transcriptional regulator [Herbaspirillum sp. alder98]
MNSRFLETFIELARTPQLRRVAERLHATPSTISVRIRSLEEELGVELFEKTQNALTLTDAGRRLRPYAETVLKAVAELREAAQQSEVISGRVRVGIIETVVLTLLPDFMRQMRALYPGIEIDLTVDLTSNLIRRLADGELDLIICIGLDPIGPHIVSENLLSLKNRWVSRSGLLAPEADVAEVFRHPLMTQMSNSAPYNVTVNLIHKMAASHAIAAADVRIASTPSLAALVSLVKEGLGVAVVPGLLVKEELRSGELVQLGLPEPKPMVISQWHLIDARPVIRYTAQVFRRACIGYHRRNIGDDSVMLEVEGHDVDEADQDH